MSYWEPERDRKSLQRMRWMAGAAGIATVLILVPIVTFSTRLDDCLARAGYTGDDPFDDLAPQECRGDGTAVGVLGLVFLLYIVATAVTGIVLGIMAGRRRAKFDGGSTGATIGLGFAVVWAFAAYCLAYGLARLLPESGSTREQSAVAQYGGDVARYTADLARHLLSGGNPAALPVTDLAMNEPVFLDAAMGAWRFNAHPADYPRTALTSVGSPRFVGGVDVATAYGNGAATRASLPMHASAWVPGGMARVLVTPTATWCLVNGAWLTVEHRAVVACDVFADAVVLNAAPGHVVLLRGPYANAVAALFTWLRSGREGLASHPLFRAFHPTVFSSGPSSPPGMTPSGPPTEPPSWAAFPKD